MISRDIHRTAQHDLRVIDSVAELRAELGRARVAGSARIGLVPTMGALHEGHLSLIDRSVGDCDLTVVSIFVNPTQFGPGEDFDRYPRHLDADAAIAGRHGADLVFAPSATEIYPGGFATTVAVGGVTERLCGAAHRRGREHFDGVATVVSKLFNIVSPDRAYFGQKDAQQVAVIKRMVRDLDFRVEVIACPTVREGDGLAMSSRNEYLSADERARALSLFRALSAARGALAGGECRAAVLAGCARDQLAAADSVEYVEIVDPGTLTPVTLVDGPVLAVVAAHVGTTRLIDNMILDPKASSATGTETGLPSTTNQIPQGAVI
ncbi:MAG: pantoate--beta-alanine ligase [Solirubrobacterales bacterium]